MDQPALVAGWLAGASHDLGFDGFQPRFLEQFTWHHNVVWSYELVRNGMILQDAKLMVHWHDGRFEGIVNHTSGRIVAIDDPALPRNDGVYYPVPEEGGGYRAITATARRDRFDDRTVLTITAPDGEVLEVVHSPDPVFVQRDDTPVFSEFPVPGGSFPDQISTDINGLVWFSDPNRNALYSFDPTSEDFTSNPTTGASGPDGMINGSTDRVWTGMYYSGGLGLLHSNTGVFTQYLAPYGGAAMAIPVETTDGHVWVTDHQANRISEFNPATETWIKSLVMPSPSCWVVQGHEDVSRSQVYFTEYNANKLGRIDLGGSTVTDLVTPGGGPAFCVYSNDKVYYSRWNENGIGVYDVTTGLFTEYQFPVANENGGPLWLRPDGDIVCGTLNRGYVMLFHVPTESFTALATPTSFPGFKDGMTVGADNVIWFTETGANKLGKLVYDPYACAADFNGDGSVNTLDVLAFLNAWVANDAGADINGDGEINTLDVLAFLNLWNAGC